MRLRALGVRSAGLVISGVVTLCLLGCSQPATQVTELRHFPLIILTGSLLGRMWRLINTPQAMGMVLFESTPQGLPLCACLR